MTTPKSQHPFHPIIYVRGYAGSQGEVEDTVADPYMGFNNGATKVRQLWTGDAEKHVFESPLIRLMKDFDYGDVYHEGSELPVSAECPDRPVFIYRYYEQASEELGSGERPEIEGFARGLGKLVLSIRERMCGDDLEQRAAFRVYVVAHSMGGLITRCFLQNPGLSQDDDVAAARSAVAKVFTYATPHNGIDVRLVGNLPGFLTRNNLDNFNRKRMRSYLGLDGDGDNASSLGGAIDPDRVFNLVGTNHKDYTVAGGAARKVVGSMSDGLVRIDNATTWGPTADGSIRHSPRAFVHRTHSGHYGVVNSEEGYQNLIRFLFGNVRVDAVLEVTELTLPPKVQDALEDGRRVRASYHFDAVVRVRGARWDLHRRTTAEESSVFRRYDQMFPRDGEQPRHPFLFSTFLSMGQRTNKRRSSLGFSVDLAVHVPEYEVDRRLWFDDHYAGGYLYRDKLNLEALAPANDGDPWRIRYGVDSRTPNRSTKTIQGTPSNGTWEFRIPVEQNTRPGLKGELVLRARPWE